MEQENPIVTAPTGDEKTLAILSHILCLVGGFLAPLIIYLIKKDESQYVSDHAKESLNFQITMLILAIGCWISMFLLIGFLLLPALGLFNFIVVIIATIRTSEGKFYRYPINFRLIH